MAEEQPEEQVAGATAAEVSHLLSVIFLPLLELTVLGI